jgi:hypothetical protein
MTITFEIPPEIEQQIQSRGGEMNAKAREAFLVEVFREREISHHQLGVALRLDRYETDGLLKRYGIGLDLSVKEIEAGSGLLAGARPQ